MSTRLIPRVRVNYSIYDLFRSLWISEHKIDYRNRVTLFLSKMFQTKNLMLTSSGRGSLYLILRSLPQKKVIIPAYTCIAVVEATLLAGKDVYYTECEKNCFNANVFKELDGDTIVIATHQYGMPCDIEKIAYACHESNAVLIEDCAGALGTVISGRQVGTFGDFGFFSFDSSKLINVPSKGGFIIAKDYKALERIKTTSFLCSPSIKFKLKHIFRGFIYCILKSSLFYGVFHYLTMGRKKNLQLNDHNKPDLSLNEYYQFSFSEWQAFIAYKQLANISSLIKKRKELFEYYDRHIQNSMVLKPIINNDAVCIRYTIRVHNRDDFYWKCVKSGVDAGFSFRNIACPASFAQSCQMSNEIINLPFYDNLTQKEIKKVIRVINSIH